MLARPRSWPRESSRIPRAFRPGHWLSWNGTLRLSTQRSGKRRRLSRPIRATRTWRKCCSRVTSSASSCCSVPLEQVRQAEMRHRASRIALLFLLLLQGGPAAAQGDIAARRAARPDVALRIYCPSGTLRVTGWTKDSVAVSGYMDPSLGRFFIGGTSDGMKLGIETQETDASGTAIMDVSVPKGARVWIKTANADVEVNAVTGTVDVFTVSGHTRVAGSPSVVTAESLDGNIELAVESPNARARTGSGTIVFRGVISEATASSVSGPLFIGME